MDQNEKLVMFGVVYVMAIDGYSRKTVDLITLPNKNATAIYNTLMRPFVALRRSVGATQGGSWY